MQANTLMSSNIQVIKYLLHSKSVEKRINDFRILCDIVIPCEQLKWTELNTDWDRVLLISERDGGILEN